MSEPRVYYRTDTGEIAMVAMGLGGRWIVCVRKLSGAIRRIKSECLPACKCRESCQAALDQYAAWKGWKEVAA